jgi:hypothetical protein
MMDCWNSGIMDIKIENSRFFVFLLIPSFQYSIIPVFQLGCSGWDKALSTYVINRIKKFPINLGGQPIFGWNDDQR